MAEYNTAISFSRFIALFLFSLFVLTGLATGATVGFDQPGITVIPGEVTMVNLTLDVAPDGFSGYRILISMEDPSIGEVSAVTLPGWAELPEITGVPGPEVSIMAVDLMSKVEKGASGVLLATLSVKGLSPGTTEMLLRDPVFTNDDGFDLGPVLSNTSFTVTTTTSIISPTTNATATTTTTSSTPTTTNATATATTSSSVSTAGSGGGGSGGGGSGGGGSGGGSYFAATTPIPGITGNETNVTITSEQTGIETAEAPVSATTPAAASTTLPETAPPVTGSQGIPFLTVPGILVLIGAMVLLGHKKR